MSMDIKEHASSMSKQFRQAAGLPERKNDKPHDPLNPSTLRRQPEPEGGYDQRGESERDERAGQVDEKLVERQQAAEELSAKSGQGANEPGGAGASTSTDATEKSVEKGGSKDAAAVAKDKEPGGSKSAKKTAAKKTAAKKGGK